MKSDISTRSMWVAVAILFGAYLIIGLTGSDLKIVADGEEYLRLADNLLHTGTFTYDGVNPVVGKPPGYPFLIAVYLRLVGSLTGFHAVQLIFMFGAFLTVALVTKRWVGRRGMVLMVLGLVCTWPLYDLAGTLYTEASFLAVTSLGIALLIRALESGERRSAVLAGVAFGLSTYLRPINLFWPVFLVVVISVLWVRRRRVVWIVAAIHLLVVSPWIVRNYVAFDRVVPMVANWGPLYYMTDEALWQVYFHEGSGVIRSSSAYREMVDGEFQFNWRPNVRFRTAALANISKDVPAYIGRGIRQTFFAWTYLPGTKAAYRNAPLWFNIGRGGMLLFYILTLAGLLRARKLRSPVAWLLAGYAVYTAIILFPVTTESRYLIPAYLWLLPLMALGSTTVWQTLQRGHRSRMQPVTNRTNP